MARNIAAETGIPDELTAPVAQGSLPGLSGLWEFQGDAATHDAALSPADDPLAAEGGADGEAPVDPSYGGLEPAIDGAAPSAEGWADGALPDHVLAGEMASPTAQVAIIDPAQSDPIHGLGAPEPAERDHPTDIAFGADVTDMGGGDFDPSVPQQTDPYEGFKTDVYLREGDGSTGIDALAPGGYKWGGAQGTGATLTYSFGAPGSVYTWGYSEPTNNLVAFNETMKQATRAALQYWSNVTNLTFVEITDTPTNVGDLRFARTNSTSSAWAYLPSPSPKSGDVWVSNNAYYDNPVEGNGAFKTLLHEIGHAIGLKHPHEGSVIADSSIDWQGMTVMSYRSFEGQSWYGMTQDLFASTPMYMDIKAIQNLYGANTSYNAGDTVYSWSAGEAILETLWDGGGQDTIDWSNQSTAAVINLNSGVWNELGPGYEIYPGVHESRTLMIADGAVIENATGGAGNDSITGNAADNVLDGGAGDDTLSGGAGNDTFVFGANFGSDTIADFAAGAADDRIDLSAFGITNFATLLGKITDVDGSAVISIDDNAITLAGVTKSQLQVDDFVGVTDEPIGPTAGDDTLTGTDGDDTLSGLGGNDTLIGGAGADTLDGGAGNDSLDGGAGDDSMSGGDGDDLYIVDSTMDSVSEAAGGGADSVRSSVTYMLAENVENLTLTGAAALDGTGNASANFLQGNNAANTLSGGAGNDVVFGEAGDDTIRGDDGDDAIWGNAGSDRIDGGAGNDMLRGGAGRDVFVFSGSFGDDVLPDFSPGIDRIDISAFGPVWFADLMSASTESGGDVVLALDGGTIRISNVTKAQLSPNDFIGVLASPTTGNDTIAGTDGADTIDGLAGRDVIDGGAGDDTLAGGDGDDTLDGGAGADTMTGGAGDDTYVVDGALDLVTENANEGTDTIRSTVSWTLGAYVENLTLAGASDIDGTGNSAANTIVGNDGANALAGGGGADILLGMGGNDTLTGGDETAQLYGGDGDDTMTGGASWDGLIGGNGDDVMYGLGDNDWMRGEAGNDTLYGGNGRDKIFGEDGNDWLDGGSSNDYMEGGIGDDTYVVDHALDVVVEGADEGVDTVRSAVSWTLGANVENLVLTGTSSINGTGNGAANTIDGNDGSNILSGGGGDDTLTGGAGDDTLDGGTGVDAMSGGAGNDSYVVDDAADMVSENAGEGIDTVRSAVTWTLGANVENLVLTGSASIDATGTEADNAITGNAAANTLIGGGGNDRLDGGGGADTMAGGLGDDTYVVDDVLDSITESAGEGVDTVEASIGWTLGAALENLTLTGANDIDGMGNAADNTILGNGGANALSGGFGADVLMGHGGDDTLNGGDDGDTLIGGAGSDAIYGEAGNDWMRGEGGDDALYGGAGIDRMFGEDGDDVLHGGAGNDQLAGGAGRDSFAYTALSEAGDLIVDFAAGAAGDSIDVSALLASFGYAGADAFGDGYVRAMQNGADAAIQVDADGSGDGYLTLATLQGVTAADLTQDNWIV